MKKLLCLFTSLLMIGMFMPLKVFSEEGIDLLNYTDKGEILGVASAFSIFVEEDFGANGCDCEGRIYAGHSANVGESRYYSTIYDNGASVVIGDGILSNFDTGHRIFVYGTHGTNLLEGGQVYQADLFDKEETFRQLKRKSIELSYYKAGEIRVNENWSSQIDFIGEDPKLNVFNLDPNVITSCNYFFNYDVPEGSYVVVNVSGKENTAYTQLYGMQYAGHRSTNNKDEINKRILFNYYDTDNLILAGTGTFYGTILAPFANVTDDIIEGTHYTGGIIAKNYLGGVEWGNCTFDGGDNYNEVIKTEETTTAIFTSNTPANTTSVCSTESKGTTVGESATNTKNTTITTQREKYSTTITTSTTTDLPITSTTSGNTTETFKRSEVYNSTTGTETTRFRTTSGLRSSTETTQTIRPNNDTAAASSTSRETIRIGTDTTETSTSISTVATITETNSNDSEVRKNGAAASDSTRMPAKTEDRIIFVGIALLIAIVGLFITKK